MLQRGDAAAVCEVACCEPERACGGRSGRSAGSTQARRRRETLGGGEGNGHRCNHGGEGKRSCGSTRGGLGAALWHRSGMKCRGSERKRPEKSGTQRREAAVRHESSQRQHEL
eukprot:1071389-Rhodomonas_salina.5